MVAVLVVAWILVLDIAGSEETCHFPQFLQTSPAQGALKPWTTRMWWLHIRQTPKWGEKQTIYVKNGQMWRHREHSPQSCESSQRMAIHKSNIGHCLERQLVYNRTCIHEEGYNTFRVIQYNADRSHRFTCMKFVKLSSNVVQVYEGPVRDTNDADLCDTSGLILDEWPWTAPWNDQASFCPFSGGFTFRTIRRLTNEDLCEDEWRRSQLEIECVKGDGMDFIAPKNSNCNPFLKMGDWKRLTCWIGWEHDDYIFIIASDVGSQPKYCLRFPRIQEGEFSVLVYFSVVCPIENDGKPVHGIEYYELRMFKNDQHSCRDENSSKCIELMTSPEICVKDKVFAPHCPKTCGRCPQSTVFDINSRRCWLDPALYGDWYLYDNSSVVEVTITREKATLTHMGTFQCLDMDMKGRRYKMASLFKNGCSPRYTCMEFMRRNNNLLQYRISPSERSEAKIDDLCTFRNDPHPLRDFFRSEHFKNLILAKGLWPSHCGLQSLIPFNGTINGRQCSGSISDWDENTCSMLGTLTLKSDKCRELVLPIEYQCVAYINDDSVPLQQLLLTRSLDGKSTYNCWVITSYVGGGHWPWRALYQLPTPQCSLVMEIDVTAGSYTAALNLDDRARKKICKPEETRQHMAQNDVTKFASTDQFYNITKQDTQGNDEIDIRLQTKPSNGQPSEYPPFTDYYNTEPPIWSLQGGGSLETKLFCRELQLCAFLCVLHLFYPAALPR